MRLYKHTHAVCIPFPIKGEGQGEMSSMIAEFKLFPLTLSLARQGREDAQSSL